MNMPILTQFNQEIQITSLDISELVQSELRAVNLSIERLAKKGVIQLPPMVKVENKQSLSPNKFSNAYIFKGEQGKLDSITVVAQLCPEFTARLVKRWYELETQQQKPTELSRMDLIQLALQAEQENQALRGQVAILEPKAIALDTIADTSHTYTLRECVKSIGLMPEKELVKLLIDKKWCYRDSKQKLQPTAQFVKNGVFLNRPSSVITNPNDGQERVFLHMRVTAFGLTRIAGMVNKAVGMVA